MTSCIENISKKKWKSWELMHIWKVMLINRVKSVAMNLIKFRKFQSAEHTAIHWPRAAMKKSPKKKWKMEKIQKCKGDKRPE